MTKKILSTLIAALSLLFLGSSCTKKSPVEELLSYSDNISGRKVKYTITVLPADKVNKNALFPDSVHVSMMMNDSLITAACDNSGTVSFLNLPTGTVSVSVKTKGYTNAFFTVNLANNDSISPSDSENMRRASSTIFLYPEKGEGTAKIIGSSLVDSDLTISGLEEVSANFKVHYSICATKNDYSQLGSGEILQLFYELSPSQINYAGNGKFEVDLPASLSGLNVCINADDIKVAQKQSDSSVKEKIFSFPPDTINCISGKTYFYQLKYQEQF